MKLYRAWSNNSSLSGKQATEFVNYIREHKNSLISVGEYIFDMYSLKTPIMLSACKDCIKYFGDSCCNGNSYGTTDGQAVVIKSNAADILRCTYNPEIRLNILYQNGVLTGNNTTTTRGNEGRCIFYDNNMCSIHKWADTYNRNYLDCKPYPCSLFPLEGIIMPTGKIFVFCSCNETSVFSMFYFTDIRRPCININTMRDVVSGKLNKSWLSCINREAILEDKLHEKFNPAYIEQKEVLEFLCSKRVYSVLKQKADKI